MLEILQRATASFAKRKQDVLKKEKDKNAVAADECFEDLLFQSTTSTVYVARANTLVHAFKIELQWSSH